MGEAEIKFDQDQYEILQRCSEAKDMTEWNDWRLRNLKADILLEEADLGRFWLEEALLGTRYCAKEKIIFRGKVYLRGANLYKANLQSAWLESAKLQGANLLYANLQGAVLYKSDLQKAYLKETDLKGSLFNKAEIQGVDFTAATVDGGTLIWDCEIDGDTDFTGVGLGNIRIDPESRQLLEYNVRRRRWERWYKWKDWFKDEHKIKRNIVSRFFYGFVRVFWWMSDYGSSTGRIIFTFFLLAFAFAGIYCYWHGLTKLSDGSELRDFIHALYFSVVTMTTLGFGDIAANPDSRVGQLLLMVQVIFGYVLLGALITRFAVLFTAGGPTLSFKDIGKPKKEDTTPSGDGEREPSDISS